MCRDGAEQTIGRSLSKSLKCAVRAQSKQVCRDGAGRTIGRSLSKSMKVRTRKMVCRDGADDEDKECAVRAQTTRVP